MHEELHRDLTVINGAEVMAHPQEANGYWDQIRSGGTTVFAATTTMKQMPGWFRRFREDDQLIHVACTADIRRAKAEDKLGIIFHIQQPIDVGEEPDNVEVLYRLGVRMMQVTYNQRNLFGDGCTERADGGLSNLGVQVVRIMNEVGMVVDVTHAGWRTAFDIIEVSNGPVIASHSNAHALCQNPRNLSDELIEAIAASGGMVGVTAFPSLVNWEEPTIEDFLDHIDYIAHRIGPERVGFGLDFCQIPIESWTSGRFSPKAYAPPPWVFPSGIATPEEIPNITQGLMHRGYSEAQIRGIMGENFLRLFDQIWK